MLIQIAASFYCNSSVLAEILLQTVITPWKTLSANRTFSVTGTVMPRDSRKCCVMGVREARCLQAESHSSSQFQTVFRQIRRALQVNVS